VKKNQKNPTINPAPVQRGALKIGPAAAYCSLSEVTMRRLCKRGLLKPNRATRHTLFSVQELDRFIAS
jgi:Helix-turn-helix domain